MKRKKLKKGVKDKPEYIHETKLVGLVDSCFRFSNLCDFQYLPMEKDEEGKLSSLYPKVFFRNLVSSDWIEKEAPLFIPPAVFSRMDAPQDYQVCRDIFLHSSYSSMGLATGSKPLDDNMQKLN